jgi:hypothetical protein
MSESMSTASLSLLLKLFEGDVPYCLSGGNIRDVCLVMYARVSVKGSGNAVGCEESGLRNEGRREPAFTNTA